MPYRNTRTVFILKALEADTDACILWPFAKRSGTPYGHFSMWFNSKQHNYYVHNFVCGLVYGRAPQGYEAAHSCGIPLCVNPRHLRWATHADNMQDAIGHGTMPWQKYREQ